MCWVDVVKFTPMSQGVRIVNFPIIPARRQDSTTNPFQLYRAATVANLTLMAGKLGLTDDTGDDPLGNHVIGAELVGAIQGRWQTGSYGRYRRRPARQPRHRR